MSMRLTTSSLSKMFSCRSQNRSVFAVARKMKLVKVAPDIPPINIIQIKSSLRSETNQKYTLRIQRMTLRAWRRTGMAGYIMEND